MRAKSAALSGRQWVKARRLSQILFLVFFLWLLINTDFKGNLAAGFQATIRIGYPVRLFMEIDPLAALGRVLGTFSITTGLLAGIAVLGLTALVGRFFCGWVCPMGTVHHAASFWPQAKRDPAVHHYRRGQKIKYLVLIFFLAASLGGAYQVGLLDPLAFLVRGLALGIFPALQGISRSLRTALLLGGGTPYRVETLFFGSTSSHFAGGWVLALLLLGAVIINRFYPRFWCRFICPLGALLGVVGRWGLFGLAKDNDACIDCGKCLAVCPSGSEPQGGTSWRQGECFSCFNCQAVCPTDALRFKLFPSLAWTTQRIDLGRRHFLASLAGGVLVVPVLRAGSRGQDRLPDRILRPPGAVWEEEFQRRCLKCGQCMKVCPTNGLQPVWFEGGVEALWTPRLDPRIGYCEYHCVLCTTVCPSGALIPLTEEEKIGSSTGRPVRIGTAFFDRGKCLPWAMNTPCIVCEEFCPTSPKAIWLENVEVTDQQGRRIKLRRPHLDPTLCVGCGICEYVCPIKESPAVVVTRAGETRTPGGGFLLPGGGS